MRACLLSLLALVPLGACSVLDTNVERDYAIRGPWTAGMVVTTGDVRLVTLRNHPLLGNPISCAEPSPDVAQALSTAVALQGKGGSGNVNASLAGSGGSAEAIAELAGRSTALLGIREGVNRACETYANGAIGQDMYGLVFSRYSQLMTTLFLAQDITGAAAADGKAQIASKVITSLLGSGAPADKSSTTAPTQNQSAAPTTTPAAAKTSAVQVTAAPANALIAATYFPADTRPPVPAMLVRVAQTTSKSAAKDNTGDTTEKTPAAAPSPSADQKTMQSTTTTTGAVSGTAALALVRMNEDYLNDRLLGLLVVACINNSDPTRFRGQITAQNAWLDSICTKLTYDELTKLMQAEMENEKAVLVDPTIGMQSSSVTTKPAPGAPAKVQSKTAKDPIIVKVQQAIAAAGCAGCAVTPDGKNGPKTKAAVMAYQKSVGLTPNGDPKDPATLKRLSVAPSKPAPAAPGGRHV